MDGLPERVRIWEVGPRDGLQNESRIIPTLVKVAFIEELADAGVPVVESASFVRPDRIPQLADATDVMTRLRKVAGTRYPVLVPNLRGLETAIACDARDIAVFASATETFAQRNLARSLADQMAMFGPVIRQARDAGIPVRGYVSMCFGDPWEGQVDPQQVADVCRELHEAGCADISLGDTIGVATPGQVTRLIRMLEASGIGLDRIGVHFHDTYGQALSNTLAALLAGVTTVGRLGRRHREAAPMPSPRPATSPRKTWCGCSTAWESRRESTSGSWSAHQHAWPSTSGVPRTRGPVLPFTEADAGQSSGPSPRDQAALDVGDPQAGMDLVSPIDRDQIRCESLHLPAVAQATAVDASHAGNAVGKGLNRVRRLLVVTQYQHIALDARRATVKEHDGERVVECADNPGLRGSRSAAC